MTSTWKTAKIHQKHIILTKFWRKLGRYFTFIAMSIIMKMIIYRASQAPDADYK